jgi:uncharacterized caspase-like protein
MVEVPVAAQNRPALHMIAVGVNYANKKDLKLDCPTNDAEQISKAFTAACVGPNNLFGQATQPHRLLEKDATRNKVLQALAEVRKQVKPQDLLVFFYAGHGVRQGKEFYLLTHDANLKNLRRTALSGSQLRERFSDFPCQVLLLLDACHSGSAIRGLLSMTDDASRQLADEECGVTLVAAALGHEKALEPVGGKNGLFTQGLLNALKRTKAVPYNYHDGRQYVHHLFSFTFDEVKALSKDQQHPFLSLPWTTESFALRQLSKPEGD